MKWFFETSIFGNKRDPIAPDWFRSDIKDRTCLKIRALWWIRNPMHNLTFYFEDKQYANNYKGEIWNPQEKLNLILPFISYKGKKLEMYFGFRPPDKGFGIALRRRHD